MGQKRLNYRQFQKSRLKNGWKHPLAKVPEHLNVGISKYHGLKCGWCKYYQDCIKHKNVGFDNNYCHWPPDYRKYETSMAADTIKAAQC